MTIDLTDLSRADLETMAEAGRQVSNCHRLLDKTGDNIVGELLKGQGTFYEMDHYPPGDAYDPETHSQYYYHAHRAGEHGHFHIFLRSAGIPEGVDPVEQSRESYMDERDDDICHLIAISMDASGRPIGLFTTNRWVTAENWYKAEDVISLLDRFDMDLAPPSWPVNVWITNMLRLFKPQIIDLIRQRDKAIDAWRVSHMGIDVFEDREMEIPSETAIDIAAQVAAIDGELKA